MPVPSNAVANPMIARRSSGSLQKEGRDDRREHRIQARDEAAPARHKRILTAHIR